MYYYNMRKILIPTNNIVKYIATGKTIKDAANKFNLNVYTLYYKLKKANIDIQALKFNHDYFECIDNEHKAYWLGFIMADGCIHDKPRYKLSIKLAIRDIDILYQFNRDINSVLPVKIYRYKDGHDAPEVFFHSTKLCTDLIRYGCGPRKSLNMLYPINLKTCLDKHFIRGYLDGDGCINIKNKKSNTPQCRFSFCGTYEFLTVLKTKLDVISKIQQNKNNKIHYLMFSGNKQCYRIGHWLYDDSTIYLKRKRLVWEQCMQLPNRR